MHVELAAWRLPGFDSDGPCFWYRPICSTVDCRLSGPILLTTSLTTSVGIEWSAHFPSRSRSWSGVGPGAAKNLTHTLCVQCSRWMRCRLSSCFAGLRMVVLKLSGIVWSTGASGITCSHSDPASSASISSTDTSLCVQGSRWLCCLLSSCFGGLRTWCTCALRTCVSGIW